MNKSQRVPRKLENLVLSELNMDNYNSVHYFVIHNQSLILVKRPLEQSEYMFNLRTKKATKKSSFQLKLSDELVMKLEKNGKEFFKKLIKENTTTLDKYIMKRLSEVLERELFEEIELDDTYRAYFNKYKYCDLLNVSRLDENSEYIFNFKSGRPTQRSPVQSQLSAELIEKLIKESCDYFKD